VWGFFDPEQEHTDAVPTDRFDRAMWDEVREQSEKLNDTVKGLQAKYDYAEDFAHDVFQLLAKRGPSLRSPEEMKATHLPNRQVAEDIASLPELERLREYTVSDNYGSAAGLLALEPALRDALERAGELRERAKAAQEAVEAAREAADNATSEEEQEAADQAAQEAQQALEDLQEQAQAQSAASRSGLRRAINDAEKELDEQQQAASSYGVDAGDLQRMNFADRAALAKRLSSDKLRKFASLIGAFRALASAEYRRRSTDGADETVGVELGDDLMRLTTQEMVNLATPETEDDFWRRFVDRGLLVKELRGREREGKGPIVVVADESGSMSGAGEMWAKGLSLALLDQAGRQKRDFHYIGFGSDHNQLREFSFPGGRMVRDHVLDMAEGFINGGTQFNKPLRRALDIVKESSTSRPDIVFITDGDGGNISFLDEWNETRKRLSVHVYGVYVTSGWGGRPDMLAKLSDDVRTVADLTDVSQVRDIMRQT